MAYDSPNAVVRREHFSTTTAGNGAINRFRSFQKAKLLAVHAIALVAGTTAGHTLTIKHGTTSIGLITLTTSAAGSVVSNTTVDATLASLDEVSLTNGTDATGTANVIYEYQVLQDAAVSA